MVNRKAILMLALLLPCLALAGEPAPATTQEIAHLVGHLKTSGCQFSRNGRWYDADEATAHLNKKHDYLRRKGLVSSAEDFISRAATESSVSGQPYLVRCGAQAPEPSGPWFRAELARYRAGRR